MVEETPVECIPGKKETRSELSRLIDEKGGSGVSSKAAQSLSCHITEVIRKNWPFILGLDPKLYMKIHWTRQSSSMVDWRRECWDQEESRWIKTLGYRPSNRRPRKGGDEVYYGIE